MKAVRRSKGPRPGGTDGERASGMTTKILSCWSGEYRDTYGCTRKGGGGGGAEERRAPQESRGNSSGHRDRHDTRAATGDETRDSRNLQGVPSPAGTARIERSLERQAGTLPGRRLTMRRVKRDSRPLRGAPSPKPLHQHPSQVLPAAQVGGEHTQNHQRDTWKGQQEQLGTGRQSVWADGG